MATEDAVKTFREKVSEGLAFREKSLESRSEWGSITFKKASPDMKRIFEILAHLSVLPVEYLTDAAVPQIQSEIDHVITIFDRIDKFNIEQQNPTQIRDQIINEIHARTDQLYTVTSPWIPFLAYQKGDIAQNIEKLTLSVTQAQTLVDGAKETIEKRQGEIEHIITKAREASAAAGAAIFTQDFLNEANALEGRAGKWLKATAGLAMSTLLFAAVMWLWPTQDIETPVILQKFGGKLAILVVLFTATLWCGRNYKALMHLSTVNRHRALSIQTLQAFAHAASDDATKDAVLMEATRAIFGSVPTGYLDGRGGMNQDLKIIEVAKTLGGKGGGGTA